MPPPRGPWVGKIDLNVTAHGGVKPCAICKAPTQRVARVELVVVPLCDLHRTEENAITHWWRVMKRYGPGQ